ncbi:hypothetical protein ACWGMA_08310 [Streptomyces asiaticus]
MTDTNAYASGVCTYGEGRAPGSGCIKPAGHDGAHCVTPGDTDAIDDDKLCPAEYPGDDIHVGQLCTRPVGHQGEHTCDAEIAGTSHTRTLTWANTSRH